jgi:predicted nucleic acid-binding protein
MRRARKGQTRFYWDTSCFIALLERKPSEDPTLVHALDATYNEMLVGRVEIVSCSILITELLEPSAQQFLRELRKHPNFELVETVTTVHELARDLRSRCRQAGVHTPKTPDALHLASGILSKCDELWTLDKRLLNSGAVITEIAVRLPHVEQLKLEF